MYIDYYLKFPSEAEADSVLYTTQADDPLTKLPKYACVDVIGVIRVATGSIDGWHVNVRHTEKVEKFATYIVAPKTPSRVWA